MTARRLTVLAAMVGLMTLAACGEQADTIEPPNAQPAEAAAAVPQQRTLDDVTSNLPAGWPATEAMRDAAAYPPHGSPWYPTPAADVDVAAFAPHGSPWYPTPAAESPEDACLNLGYQGGIPQPC